METVDFYKTLRKRVQDWAVGEGKTSKWMEYVLIAPDLFYLLCKLMFDTRVPSSLKAKLGLALAYYVSPIDLLPEALLGPLGLIDDIAVSAYVLNLVLNVLDPAIIKENWPGEGDILEWVKKIVAHADEMVGSGLWNKIKQNLDGK
jgi:uncharacterized membrane protein YkvA (DUF1232 family)